MATQKAAEAAGAAAFEARKRRLPPEVNILLVLVGIALIYEVLGWIFIGQSFLANPQRLTIMILQVSVIGIIAVGVTQVIITGGIDLSSGSVVGMTAMIAASLAQSSSWTRALYPSLTDLPAIVPILVGLGIGLLAGTINGVLIAYTKIPPFIATLGMMVSARGVSKWYTKGQPVSGLTDSFNAIGTGIWPVVIFLTVAVI
ncbi:ABC transporter permease, partial [Salmonella enterica subsp. enterica serovar Virchow]|nr:ABC transporter permease [Salmonella enterica subsp. enterica serovar Virchow]